MHKISVHAMQIKNSARCSLSSNQFKQKPNFPIDTSKLNKLNVKKNQQKLEKKFLKQT